MPSLPAWCWLLFESLCYRKPTRSIHDCSIMYLCMACLPVNGHSLLVPQNSLCYDDSVNINLRCYDKHLLEFIEFPVPPVVAFVRSNQIILQAYALWTLYPPPRSRGTYLDCAFLQMSHGLYSSGLRNVRPVGFIRPLESFVLVLPRQPQMGLKIHDIYSRPILGLITL